MKAIARTIAAAFLVCLVWGALETVGEAKNLESEILRIHIRADSDSENDQQIKLKVRDEILKISAELFEGCVSLEETLEVAQKNIPLFERAANEVLKREGAGYTASVKIKKEFFARRDYGDISIPAGIYEAVIIELGSAKGENWWCMLYPSLCFSGGRFELDDESLKKALGEEGFCIVTGGENTIVKFKFLEIWAKIRDYFSKK